MLNNMSFEEHIPANIPAQPTNAFIAEYRPVVTDITLYGGLPDTNPSLNQQTMNHEGTSKKPLSFKDWKEKQDLKSINVPNVYQERKHVRFDETNSLPPVICKTVSTPFVEQQQQQHQSLPGKYLINPPICKNLDMSMTEPTPKAPTQYQFSEPLMQGLFKRNVEVIPCVPQAVIQRQPSLPTPPPPSLSQCRKCKCDEIRETDQQYYLHHQQKSKETPSPVAPVAASSSPNEVHNQQISQMNQQFITMQEEIRILQMQVAMLLNNQTASSATTLTHETKRSSSDASTQVTIIETAEKVDAQVNTTHLPETSDLSFMHDLQGEVNYLLQQTDDTRLNSREVKFIDSDLSAESFVPSTNNNNNKKATEKSSFVNNLTQKYLRKSTDAQHQDKVNKPTTNDVSTTCYNYMMKYDLIGYDNQGFSASKN